MKRFMVRVIEVCYQPVVVEAMNKRDAIAKVRGGHTRSTSGEGRYE